MVLARGCERVSTGTYHRLTGGGRLSDHDRLMSSFRTLQQSRRTKRESKLSCPRDSFAVLTHSAAGHLRQLAVAAVKVGVILRFVVGN